MDYSQSDDWLFYFSCLYFCAYMDYNISTKGNSMKKNNTNHLPDTIKTSEAINNGYTKPFIYQFLKENDYDKVASGIYVYKDSLIDNLYIIHERCPQAVISHDEALYYHRLIDREPLNSTLTIYSGYNATKLKKANYRVFFVKKELLNMGKTIVQDNFGNNIPMYDMERTICDLIRNRSTFEVQDINSAIKNYVKRKDKDINKLMKYAKTFHVDSIIKQYLGVLL